MDNIYKHFLGKTANLIESNLHNIIFYCIKKWWVSEKGPIVHLGDDILNKSNSAATQKNWFVVLFGPDFRKYGELKEALWSGCLEDNIRLHFFYWGKLQNFINWKQRKFFPNNNGPLFCSFNCIIKIFGFYYLFSHKKVTTGLDSLDKIFVRKK